MSDSTPKKGAWRWSVTIKDGVASERETYWDPEAEPMSDSDYQRLLHILFAPRPQPDEDK